MKKRHTDFRSHDENVFAMSTGDLMASLLFIFILLLTSALLQVQEKSEEDERTASAYNEIKQKLYEALMAEFKRDELEKWHASIDRDTLCIRFQEPNMMFDEGKSDLKAMYKDILDDFFPRYVDVLLMKGEGKDGYRFRDSIAEIRIEGHTNSNGGYFYNMNLSQSRAMAVLVYCMNEKKITKEQQNWLMKTFTANGMSYSHPVYRDGNGNICPESKDSECPGAKEDLGLSRRVEFRVRTDAEKQLEEIAERRKQGSR